ncbi:MAG: RNA-binding transcriptional accessory protein [Candidatus Latescibacteria bacterium]|jgi:protein Tex|nr:RNA-binding transcriptional accessory protein [Candidatus Latescibacterota bacterium]
MLEQHISIIAGELSIKIQQVQATAGLLDDEATVPFIARYRKEVTGSLDEVAIMAIRDRLAQLRELDKRREAILKSLEDRELLTDELKSQINAAETLTNLEDIYLPYRPKRRTRATVAKEKGLEPLAQQLYLQDENDPVVLAEAYVDAEKEVASIDDALAGARDIIAEWVSEDQKARERMRELFSTKGLIRSKVMNGKETTGTKFKDYFEWEETIKDAPSHRILAMRRGESEEALSLTLTPDESAAVAILEGQFVTGTSKASDQVRLAVQDGYKRLLSPSMETEIRTSSKDRADAQAIIVFAENLRELLLAAPLGSKNVLALDPGLRTGCKLVCLDGQGKLLHTDTIFPHTGDKKRAEAGTTLCTLCEKYGIEAIAIGNGTGSRETETFVRALEIPGKPITVLVNEAGASIYSASETARREFPDHDLTVRGSVSIGRRLMDPLAELVKIDPKSIGVGQYQHDVDQAALKHSLDDTVVSCVNNVGVELNTASPDLLAYVSGVGPNLAQSIVAYREENGPFDSRSGLLKVPRFGPKAFEQAAGFLRIQNGENPLDGSGVHPESYDTIDRMVQDLGCDLSALLKDDALRSKIELEKYTTDTIGMPTLQDIIEELKRPGRDPRNEFETVTFADGIMNIDDVKAGMQLQGVVTNVTAFGAFVDVGVHQDGLVHISQLANRFVKDASEVVKVNQKVKVTVLSVDMDRRRISLSMRDDGGAPDNREGSGARTEKKKKPRDNSRRQGGKKQQGTTANDHNISEKKRAKAAEGSSGKTGTINDLMGKYGKL